MPKQSPIEKSQKDNIPDDPISQEADSSRKRRWFGLFKKPAFMKDFPNLRMPPADEEFQLLPEEQLEEILRKASPEVAQEVQQDIKLLEEELFHYFRDRDRQASVFQNRYRLYQMWYVLLAFLATILGAAQALAAGTQWLPWFAFGETLIALAATMIATISSFEPPFPKWIQNRRIAEFLRQEYFRYLMRAEPYDHFNSVARRKMHLARRAAEINQGLNPNREEME